MTGCTRWWMAVGLTVAVGQGAAQAQYREAPSSRVQAGSQVQRWSGPTGYGQRPAAYRMAERPGAAGQPSYPATDQALAVQPPGGPQQASASPFPLTPQEQAQVDWVLRQWERHSAGVKTFECKFTRFVYDPIFHDPKKPKFIEEGEIRYAAPDKGMFRVFQPRGVTAPREEHWICNGKSIFQYDFQKKQLVQYELPTELQGKAITRGPLPFLFGAKAGQLKERYFLRIARVVTPEEDDRQDEVWLDACPRFQTDAANMRSATLILTTSDVQTLTDMQPFAVRIIMPNGQNETRYRFRNIKVNARSLLDPLRVFETNWLHAGLPPGWTKISVEAPAQAGRPGASNPRR